MAMTERAAPYLERLMDDRELQRDLREAVTALRGSYGRAEKKNKKPSRLMGDKRFKQNAQRAAESLRDASKRFRGEPPKSHRGRKVLMVLLVGGAASALAAKKMMQDDASAPEMQTPQDDVAAPMTQAPVA
jgi:hypothetical protein